MVYKDGILGGVQMRPEIRLETLEMYEKHCRGSTLDELAAAYFISKRAISRRFQLLELPHIPCPRRIKIDEQTLKSMYDLRSTGMSYARIASKFGVSKETINRAFARSGLSDNDSIKIWRKKGKMTLNEYQTLAQRTSTGKHRLDNGCLGLAGESGECCDILKKHRFQGHELDVNHLIEELGDVMWYVAEAAAGIGVTLEDVAKRNVEKLERRYPSGFDAQRSIHRGA